MAGSTSGKPMRKEDIDSRFTRVLELLRKEPDLPTRVVQERVGCGPEVVRKLRRQVQREQGR